MASQPLPPSETLGTPPKRPQFLGIRERQRKVVDGRTSPIGRGDGSTASAGMTTRPAPERMRYGVVVLRVNVSVLLYVPVRSGSLAAIDCLNVIGTDSLEVGAVHVLIVPRPCSGDASAKRAVDQVAGGGRVLGSATLSVASPAVEMTVAVVLAVYVLGDAGRERAERAPARPSSGRASPGRCRRPCRACRSGRAPGDLTADVLPLKSVRDPLERRARARGPAASGSSRGRFGFHSVEAVVGVEPSVV